MVKKPEVSKVRTKLLIVSPCQLFAEGLKKLLEHKMRFSMCYACDCHEASEILNEKPFQLAIVALPCEECLFGIRLLKRTNSNLTQQPGTKVLVINNQTEWKKIKVIMDAGVSGYLLESSSSQRLFQAIFVIMAGGTYVDEGLRNLFFQSLTNCASIPKRFGHQKVLSKRELEVLQLAGKDYSSKEIAGTLFICNSTVETHRKKIISKLGVKSITGALDAAYRQGMLEFN